MPSFADACIACSRIAPWRLAEVIARNLLEQPNKGRSETKRAAVRARWDRHRERQNLEPSTGRSDKRAAKPKQPKQEFVPRALLARRRPG